MAEDGESPGIVKAQGLLNDGKTVLAGMRTTVAQNALGGSEDPRRGIEADLNIANAQLTEAQRRVGGVPRELVNQTSAGRDILMKLAGEVGHEPSPSVTAAVETTPVAEETKSTSSLIFNTIKSLFRK